MQSSFDDTAALYAGYSYNNWAKVSSPLGTKGLWSSFTGNTVNQLAATAQNISCFNRSAGVSNINSSFQNSATGPYGYGRSAAATNPYAAYRAMDQCSAAISVSTQL